MSPAPAAYSPATLAKLWSCSDQHVRNLVAAGKLRAFHLGGKLLRIPADAVEEFLCQNTVRTTASGASGENSPSSGETPPEDGTVTRLEPLTRARLATLRRLSSPS